MSSDGTRLARRLAALAVPTIVALVVLLGMNPGDGLRLSTIAAAPVKPEVDPGQAAAGQNKAGSVERPEAKRRDAVVGRTRLVVDLGEIDGGRVGIVESGHGSGSEGADAGTADQESGPVEIGRPQSEWSITSSAGGLPPSSGLTVESSSPSTSAEARVAELSTTVPFTAVPSTTSAPNTMAPTTTVNIGPSTSPQTSSATSTSSTTSTSNQGSLVWEEHFDRLDTGRWRLEHSSYGDGNGERQCYRPENVRVAGGKLILTARHETYSCPRTGTRTVTSGMVRSQGLTFSPGQGVEFRVKLTPADSDDQAGPAVWASSWAGSWPRGGEMDWLEVMTAENPKRSMHSIHFADASGRHALKNRGAYLDGDFSDDWHTIRFDYGHGGHLRWYLDGRPVFEVTDADTLQGYPAPFDQKVGEIKINLAIGGTPGPLSWGALGSSGATFEVGYIKVFNL